MINLKNGVSSRVSMEVLGVDGAVRKTMQFCNVMTNYGLNSWTKGALGTHLALGSGTRTELPTVTDLAGYIRSTAGTYSFTNTNFIDNVNRVMRSDHILNVVFPVETVAQNYSEMGIHNNNINELQTYALIRDTDGLPTSIGVRVGEQVRVSYVVQYSTPLLQTESVFIGPTETTMSIVPLATGSVSAVRLPNTDGNAGRLWAKGQNVPVPGIAPTGGIAPPRAATASNGQYTLSVQLTEANLVGGISLIRMGGTSGHVGLMCHFDPPLAKNDSVSMTVNVTTTLTNGAFYA